MPNRENKIILKNKRARAEAKELCSRLDKLDEEYKYSDSNISIFAFGKYFLPMTFYKLRMKLCVREHKNSLDAWM
ncbi:MAG: hypothetical protein IKR04_02300 [Clostridia bacterium]|nr:hypothetical protein [Clostridia bacterium]